MLFARGLAATLALVSTPSADAQVAPPHHPNVMQVVCDSGKGTAFRISDGRYLSADHVTKHEGCAINGRPVVAIAEPDLDFSVLQGDGRGGLKINCEGFKAGQYYHSIGYAKGLPWQMVVTVMATYRDADNGMRVLLGYPTFIPGMSGGPVMNQAGEVVGIVNMYSQLFPLSFSRAMKDTSLCK